MKISTTLAAVIGFAALAACGGGEDTTANADENAMMTDMNAGMDMNMTDMNGMDMNMTDMNAGTDMNMTGNTDMNMTGNTMDMNTTGNTM